MSWIFYTIAATIFQTFRNLEQKQLNKTLDEFTVSWSRFILPLPFAIIVIFITYDLVSLRFIELCFITALAQVGGNIFLLKTFKSKNFNIGIAFYKTETLQAMFLGLIFFNDKISNLGIFCVLIAMIGVILMSGSIFNQGVRKFFQSLTNEAAFYGLLCGFCFSISAFNLKFATQAFALENYSMIEASLVVLLWVIAFQNIFFTVIKISQKRFLQDLGNMFKKENKFLFLKTSILSFLGSICWFIAFGLGKVVYVKVIGQIELVWASLVSHYILHEKMRTAESIGIIFTVLGIVGVILFH